RNPGRPAVSARKPPPTTWSISSTARKGCNSTAPSCASATRRCAAASSIWSSRWPTKATTEHLRACRPPPNNGDNLRSAKTARFLVLLPHLLRCFGTSDDCGFAPLWVTGGRLRRQPVPPVSTRGDTRGASGLSFHQRIRFRRPSRQGVRPHLG